MRLDIIFDWVYLLLVCINFNTMQGGGFGKSGAD